MFDSQAGLKTHIQETHPKSKCHECGETCDNDTLLRAHMLNHADPQTEQALLRCHTCAATSFVSKNELIAHYHTVHNGTFPSGFLTTSEVGNLEKILNDSQLPSLQRMQRDSLFKATIVNGEENIVPFRGRPKVDAASSSSPLPSVEQSVIKMILGNYTKSYTCPKKNCQRKFTRHHAYVKHLVWHEKNIEKMDEYLKSIGAGSSDEEEQIELDHFSDLDDSDFSNASSDVPEKAEMLESGSEAEPSTMLDDIKTTELELDALIYMELQLLQP